jgi:hypothetical protein
MLFALYCGWKSTRGGPLLLSSQLLLSEKSGKCAGLGNHLAMSLRIYLKFNPLISYHNRRASDEVFTIRDQRMIANRMESKGRSQRG